MTQDEIRNIFKEYIDIAEKNLINIPFTEVLRLQREHTDWLTTIYAFLEGLKYEGINYFKPSKLDTMNIKYKINYIELIGKIKEEINLLTEEVLPNVLSQLLVTQKMGIEFTDPYYIEGYEKKERLGNGGYGEVYRYYHRRLELDFAIKFFDQHILNPDSSGLERFFQEAKILHTLNHPRIVRIYDVNMRQNRPYFRMDCINGNILKDVGALNPNRCLDIIKQIAEGVQYAHKKQVIHRDLKESNIIVDDNDNITIIDFGIGVFIDASLDKSFTATGDTAVGGQHTAPELLDDPRLRDNRSDIYSIGSIWFKLLTGISHQGKQVAQVIEKLGIQNDKMTSVLNRCLNPIDERYNSCDELLEDLISIREDC